MDSAKKILFVVCSVLSVVTLLSGYVTSLTYDENFPSDDYDMLPIPVDKRASNPFCRRCRIHRDEWMSCSLCYGKPKGIVPYYGKRSAVEDYEDDGLQQISDDLMTKVTEKRSSRGSFLDSRCCHVLGIQQCCRRSNGKRGHHTVYFPTDVEDKEQPGFETWKREYETSFVPLETAGNGQCSCCNGSLFDFSCCSLACVKRK